MSRYDGWLVRFIMMHGTPAALTVAGAAKESGVRRATFEQALRDPRLVRADAKCIGIDPDEWLELARWNRLFEADEDVAQSMADSADARTPRQSGDKYKGVTKTTIGTRCPNPAGARSHTDDLGLPINPVHHPEPDGEWHAGLDGALPIPTRRSGWVKRRRYMEQCRKAS